ncbi:MAG TPA: SMC-Scp complex subunit ScpB [Luteitalea sp.]|nr:SMC-Scp complex subunit ScpB [Luteitalea sp.]
MSDEQTPDLTVDETAGDTQDTPDTSVDAPAPAKGSKRGKGRQKSAAPADEPVAASVDDDTAPVEADLPAEESVAEKAVDDVAAADGEDAAEAAVEVDDETVGLAELGDPELFDPSEVADAPRAPHPLKPVVEALIFASPEPMTVKVMQRVLEDQTKEDIEAALVEVRESYARSDGLQLVEVAGGFQIVTRPELYEWVRRLFKERTTSKLSVQALETLAVIAYKQPVTSGEIAEIRGVSATTGVLNTLLDRKLVKIVGRKQVVGRPFMYGTTREFLDKFGLRDLSDLPKVEDMSEALGFDLPSPVDEGDGVSLPFDGPVEASLFDDGDGSEPAAVQADEALAETGAEATAERMLEPSVDANDAADAAVTVDDESVNADTSDEER